MYIEEEIYAPENQAPPLGEGFALAAIRSKARNYRRAGTDVGEILQASQRLAHAQSERQATACRLLPPVHWALLYTIGALFVSTFILFETGGSFSNEGRHILFTVLCGLMSFVLCVSTFHHALKLHSVLLWMLMLAGRTFVICWQAEHSLSVGEVCPQMHFTLIVLRCAVLV